MNEEKVLEALAQRMEGYRRERKARRRRRTADLEAETQWATFELCGQDTDLFCATMAIAYSESRFAANLLGDNGKSVGMMQINTDYH